MNLINNVALKLKNVNLDLAGPASVMIPTIAVTTAFYLFLAMFGAPSKVIILWATIIMFVAAAAATAAIGLYKLGQRKRIIDAIRSDEGEDAE